jgi:hypothetical protein
MDSEKQKSDISDDKLTANGFHKSVKENGVTYFSKRIQNTNSDFIIMKSEEGLFSAPQIHTPGVTLNEMIIDDNQNDLLRSMEEINSYYKKAINKLHP